MSVCEDGVSGQHVIHWMRIYTDDVRTLRTDEYIQIAYDDVCDDRVESLVIGRAERCNRVVAESVARWPPSGQFPRAHK